jgi:hypothetical protein
MSPKFKDYYISFSQLLTGERVAFESRAAAQRSQDIEPYLPQSSPLRVLDLANGRLQPQYLLLKAAGHQVFGIDLVNHPPFTSLDHAYRLARWLYTSSIFRKMKSGPGKTDWFAGMWATCLTGIMPLIWSPPSPPSSTSWMCRAWSPS